MRTGLGDIKEYWKYIAYYICGYDISTCGEEGIVL